MAATLTEKIKTVLLLVKEPAVLKALISQRYSGYLKDVGWFNSFAAKNAIDKNFNPIPWTTYPFIDFIQPRLNKKLDIFEYGSGNSTKYFSSRVNTVTSIEHNKEWYEQLIKTKSNNINLILSAKKDYVKMIDQLDKLYHLIFVDGEDRVECIYNSVNRLTEDGVIVLDDSERKEYEPGIEFLIKNGFKNLEFWGIAPLVLFKKCTSVFYKENNCLGI
jgi:hypothetical protein